jgi:hypothetical protein
VESGMARRSGSRGKRAANLPLSATRCNCLRTLAGTCAWLTSSARTPAVTPTTGLAAAARNPWLIELAVLGGRGATEPPRPTHEGRGAVEANEGVVVLTSPLTVPRLGPTRATTPIARLALWRAIAPPSPRVGDGRGNTLMMKGVRGREVARWFTTEMQRASCGVQLRAAVAGRHGRTTSAPAASLSLRHGLPTRRYNITAAAAGPRKDSSNSTSAGAESEDHAMPSAEDAVVEVELSASSQVRRHPLR